MRKLDARSPHEPAFNPNPLMRLSCSLCSVAAFAAALSTTAAPSRSLAAQTKETVLIDFTSYPREPNGDVTRPYEYAFGDWNKHIVDLRGRGTLIKAPSGKGGMGENKTMVEFSKSAFIDLQIIIGNANKSEALNFSIEDKDGSEQTWTIPLKGKPTGQLLHHRLDITKPDSEPKPGKTPGMNFKKISTWQVRGNYADPSVEVLLVKLSGEK